MSRRLSGNQCSIKLTGGANVLNQANFTEYEIPPGYRRLVEGKRLFAPTSWPVGNRGYGIWIRY